MNREKLISTILDLLAPDECKFCYKSGIQCKFNPISKVRVVTFDLFDQFPLPTEEYNCKIRAKPNLITPELREENAKSLRSLRDELRKISHSV